MDDVCHAPRPEKGIRAPSVPEWLVTPLSASGELGCLYSIKMGVENDRERKGKKGAIRVVPHEESHSSFYSRYFLTRGRRGMRAILDLRVLNHHLRIYKFKMLTYALLLWFVSAGDWYTLIDLRDVHSQIPVYPRHWKYLRFASQGIANHTSVWFFCLVCY